MTIIGTNSQGLTHNSMQLKNDTAEWMSEYLADSYSKISNIERSGDECRKWHINLS